MYINQFISLRFTTLAPTRESADEFNRLLCAAALSCSNSNLEYMQAILSYSRLFLLGQRCGLVTTIAVYSAGEMRQNKIVAHHTSHGVACPIWMSPLSTNPWLSSCFPRYQLCHLVLLSRTSTLIFLNLMMERWQWSITRMWRYGRIYLFQRWKDSLVLIGFVYMKGRSPRSN